MRLLQLNPNADESSALDFHPMVTVVTSLSAAGREKVIRAITALPRGGDPGCDGLVESHGILLDLSPETLGLLDLHGDLDVLVRASDIGIPANGSGHRNGSGDGGDRDDLDDERDELAGFDPGTGHRAPADRLATVLPASVEPLSVEDFLAITPEGEHPELDDARLRVAQAQEACDVLRGAWDLARTQHEERQVKRRRAEHVLEAARTGRGRINLRIVTDGDDTADGELDEGAIADAALIEARRDELTARRAELEGEVARVDRGIQELAGVDVRPIQVLLDAIHNPGAAEMVPSRRGIELADEFARLQHEVGALEEALETRGLGSASALARLDAARDELALAERAMRPPQFTDDDRAELESAHDEVLEAERRSRGRSGKKRLDEAIDRERTILDKMGFPTWSAYVMGSSLMGIDPAAEQRLERARFEFDAAEQHWSDVAAMIEADPSHGVLLDRLESVYLEAFDLLGGDDDQSDLEDRLRSHQEAYREVSVEELVDALGYQLEVVGLGLPAGMATLDRTVLVAETFLEEASAIQGRIRELGDEKVEALTELQEIEDEIDSMPAASELARSPHGERPRVGRDDDGMIDLTAVDRDDVSDREGGGFGDDAADDEEHGDEGDDDLARLEADLVAAIEDERDYEELVEARDALVDTAIRVQTIANAKLRKLAGELALLRADAENEAAMAAFAAAGTVEDDSETALAVDVSDADEMDAFDALAGDTGGSVPDDVWRGDADLGHDLTTMFDGGGERAAEVDREKLEFYLLARLAALRSVSFAGSVPLVIDDALLGQSKDDVEVLLTKLERMSESVQIVYLSDDETVRDWADNVGFERAAVVRAPLDFA
jgi:hypothetical protein